METLVKQDIENTHSFFESKEHYFKFIDAWSQYIADGKHKCETYIDGQGGTCKHDSSLTSVHHLIYNGLRKRDLHKSYSPLTKPTKLALNYDDPYAAFNDDLYWLQYYGRSASDLVGLLEPFGGTVTKAMIVELGDTLKDVKL
jgi:hypothetical protein